MKIEIGLHLVSSDVHYEPGKDTTTDMSFYESISKHKSRIMIFGDASEVLEEIYNCCGECIVTIKPKQQEEDLLIEQAIKEEDDEQAEKNAIERGNK